MDFQKVVEINNAAIEFGIQSIRHLSLFLRICDAGGEVTILELVGKDVPSCNSEYKAIYYGLRQMMAGEAKRDYNGINLIRWKERGLIGFTAKGRKLSLKIKEISGE